MNTDEVAVTAKAKSSAVDSNLKGITPPRGFKFKLRYCPSMNRALKKSKIFMKIIKLCTLIFLKQSKFVKI